MSNHSKSGSSRVDKLKRLSNITSKDGAIGRRGSSIYSSVHLKIKKPELKHSSNGNGVVKSPPSITTSPKPASVENFIPEETSAPLKATDNITERKILQEIWLWTSRVFLKAGLIEECEQCIVEAESIYEPNIKTFTALGF